MDDSIYSSPEKTPQTPKIVESSTPWSDVLLGNLAGRYRFQSPPIVGHEDVHRAGLTFRKSILGRFWWIASAFLLVWLASIGRLQYRTKIVGRPKLEILQFIDSNHPNVRYVGRWLSAIDETHKDGSFPGIYFEFSVIDCTTVILSLHNSDKPLLANQSTDVSSDGPPTDSFTAAPISLLAQIDDDEYIVLPDAMSLVAIREGNLDKSSRHRFRIIAPMTAGENIETIQLKGIWIDKEAKLLPNLHFQSDKTILPEEDNTAGRRPKQTQGNPRMLEVVTDLPGTNSGKDKDNRSDASHGILGGVLGWDYLLGEMFGADHFTIGMDGMCLIPECIGGRASPAGLGDVYFQSGPAGSEQYAFSWPFQDYVPDVIVMNIGNSDWDSFQKYNQRYNKTMWELSIDFETTYISLLKAIRTLAYATTDIPIFVMRPLRGQLEQATHTVVERMRNGGDNAIFWLDTSGWLKTEVHFDKTTDNQDFFLDEDSASKQWRLTERGNQRVAILLHMHVCRYLDRDAEKCAFLPPESYSGQPASR